MAFTPRLVPPQNFGTYYTERRLPVQRDGVETGWQYFYSGDYTYTIYGPHTGNCTWYAMGRSAEIANRNLYSEFRGSYDAQNWNNIWIGNPAQTSGSITYKLGDILVYSTSGGGAGHVEVVEEINGNILTISYSAYSSYTPQSEYGTFFGTRTRSKMVFGDTASDNGEPGSAYTRNNGQQYYMLNEYLIGVIHNPYADPTPPEPPTPTEYLDITITPASYSRTMNSSEDYLDFNFTIQITGIPAGETVSGGNTYPGLSRVYNSGWSYSSYTVSGVTYQSAYKQQTLRYDRESSGAYTTTKHMYFNITKSTGTINTDTPMYITVQAKTPLKAIIGMANRRRRAVLEVK